MDFQLHDEELAEHQLVVLVELVEHEVVEVVEVVDQEQLDH
jgi:hypothetical protein